MTPPNGPDASRAAAPSGVEHKGDDNAYERVKTLAVREWRAGNWAEARALFLIAHGLRPSARTWRALGMMAFELRQYREAVSELAAALADPRDPLDPTMQREVRELLAQAEAYIVRYEVRLEPPHARLLVDGVDARREPDGTLILAVGSHTLDVEAEGYVSVHRELVVPGEEGSVLSLRLSRESQALPQDRPKDKVIDGPKPPPLTDKHWFRDYPLTWSMAGGSALSGATSLGLYLGAVHKDEQAEQYCDNDCMENDPSLATLKRERETLTRWSYVALGGAAAFAAASVALFFYEHGKPPRRSARAARSGRRVALGPSALVLRF